MQLHIYFSFTACTNLNTDVRLRLCLVHLRVIIAMLRFVCLFVLLGLAPLISSSFHCVVQNLKTF